jgi:hypothetical protein
MTDLDQILAEIEAARVELTADDLNVSQRKALKKLIALHVRSFHEIKKLDIHTTGHGYVYVYCVAGIEGDEGTAAELFARTGFHVCLGSRGGVKHL